MKKKKKRIPAAPTPRKSRVIKEPPASVIKELVSLFNAGELGFFGQKASEAVQLWPKHPFGWKALANFLLRQGRLEDALAPLLKSVQLDPDDFQARNNLGSVLLELRRLGEAEENFRQALALNPEYAQAHNNLGITLLERGCFEEAVACYRQALSLMPNFVEAHNNLGNGLKELGHLKKAEASYRQALVLNQDFAEGHYNLGNVLLRLREIGKAKKSYQQALELKPDYAQAHSGLGDVLLKRGQLNDAIASYRKCLELEPLEVKAHDGLNKALGFLVPLWHVPMMNDRFRNDAYCAALQNAVTPDTHVLEIGTGSGLLAMMAAKLGARQVTTCEAVAEIAETARAIVADNGFTPPITVIPKLSTKLAIGKDMDERADLLVSEILSSEFLGEGVLSSIEDAKRRLLKPGAQIIPARGSIQFALFSGTDIEKNIRVDEVYNFDLSRFNEIIPRKQYISRNDLNIELLSDATCAFSFDFVETDRFPPGKRESIEVPVRKAGRCCGIIQWLRLEMDETVVFENHPSIKNPATSWQHCAYVFPKAIDLQPGQVAVVSAAHNRDTPWFFFKGLK